MSDDRKREKTRREDYCPLDDKPKQKKSLVFGKKSKDRKKKDKKTADENPQPPLTNPFGEERGVFGAPLCLAVARMPSHDGVRLPLIVRQCIDYVNEHGLDVEGIYRICAPKSRLDELESAVNARRAVVLNDVHDAAGLFKRFLRQIPSNILTDNMRITFEKIAAKCPCRALPTCSCLVADLLKAQLSQLPIENYTLLAYVFLHARLIMAHQANNKMGMAAMGLILQAALNMSQLLLRILLTNTADTKEVSDKTDKMDKIDKADMTGIADSQQASVVYFFTDVQIKRYVAPRQPKSLNESNLPETERELVEEEAKQRSHLSQLHNEIEELRELGVSSKQQEDDLWDVQTAITLLNRKLKSVRGRRASSTETNGAVQDATGPKPSLEMFQEKQLMATCTALREDIAHCKADIITLDTELQKDCSSQPLEQKNIEQNGQKAVDEAFWKDQCQKEEVKRTQLLDEVVEQREQCSLLRAKLELNAVKQPTLLVTRF